jgi:alkylation response protein AidB-like acyl-CoA dehydrogenase
MPGDALGVNQTAAHEDVLAMIRDSADAIGPRDDLSRIRRQRFHGAGVDREAWKQMAELGWIGVMVPESKGGLGLGVTGLAVLSEEMGARLVPEPLIETAIAATLLDGTPLSELIAGARLILPAWQSRANQLLPDDGVMLHGGRATGLRRFVYGGETADTFVLMTERGAAVVERNASGVSLKAEPTRDGGAFATLQFDAAVATLIDVSVEEMALALDAAALATSAYLLGLMQRAFQLTLEYLRNRQQFGKAIGTFQALQHRAADLYLQIALTRASVSSAVALFDRQVDSVTRQSAVSRAKVRAADAAMLVTRQAIQLHGGIGYTDEHDIGLFLRRAMVMANRYGSAPVHRARFAQLSALFD